MAGVRVGRVAVACGLMLAGMGLLEVRAADVGEPMPEPVAEPVGWEGPYVGAHVGFNALRSSNTVVTGPAQKWHQDDNGWLGGILVGYNFELDGFVLGFEADAGFGDVSDAETRPGIGKVTITDHGQHTFRARAGVPTSIGLLYVTGGLGLSDIWIKSPSGKDKNFHTGFVVGGGIEGKLMDSLSIRGEYLFSSYGDEKFNLGATTLKSGFDAHTVRLGVSWYFW